jgi:hypothetical protein
MALIKCHECGKKVSTESSVCPGCGAAVRLPPPKAQSASISPILKIFFIGLFLYTFALVIGLLFKETKSPEEIKQEANAQEQKNKQLEIEIKRINIAAIAAKTIQQSARNPDSVSWTKILANDDASVICYQLRAENGFGGLNTEDIAVIKGVLKTSDAAWNKYCAGKPMNNITTDVVKVLKRYY